MKDIEELLAHKELGQYDFGSVKLVRPTGRYIDANELEKPELTTDRLRFIVEVKSGLFSKHWVPASQLKPIRAKGQA